MFDEPLRIARLLSNYEGIWMIAGGWAIDLFLNRETRTHQDIEIAIPRKEQFLLLAYLQNWTFQYAHSGELYKWKKDHYLQLPIHEIQGNFQNEYLEILLNEIEGPTWHFRRNLEITYPTTDVLITSKMDIPILSPEVVLLYKAKQFREKDQVDLLSALPHMKKTSIQWLKDSIKSVHSDHEWLQLI